MSNEGSTATNEGGYNSATAVIDFAKRLAGLCEELMQCLSPQTTVSRPRG